MAKSTARASVKPVNFESLVAEAAYYRAEQRGFTPGNEMADWLDAEREIETAMTPKQAAKKAKKPAAGAKKKKAAAKA
jgi:hypothetical protein